MKLLVADDDPVWRELLVKQLRRFGYEVVEAADGQQAWQQLRQDDPPRLVLLDWQMPDLDGLALCKKLKADPKRAFTYVIILSSRDNKEDMVAGLDAGADDYLAKPVDASVLRSRLAAARRIVEAVPPREWAKPQIPGFHVERLIGRGAFATVWAAKRLKDGRAMAVKVLRVDLATEDVFGRFAREIEVMKRFDHPHIARIHASRIDREWGYYAMDLVEGRTVDRYVKRENPSGLEIVELIAKVCDGLQHAHEQGVIHRDVKPSNIMIGPGGEPKLVDFGLSKSMFWPTPEEDSADTLDGAVIGSPLFMAPEQARGENDRLDERTDLYSVGVILYTLLLRRLPRKMEARERWEAIKQIAEGHVEPPRSVNPNFSRNLEQILMKAMAECPDQRYATAEALAAALRNFIAKRHKRGNR